MANFSNWMNRFYILETFINDQTENLLKLAFYSNNKSLENRIETSLI